MSRVQTVWSPEPTVSNTSVSALQKKKKTPLIKCRKGNQQTKRQKQNSTFRLKSFSTTRTGKQKSTKMENGQVSHYKTQIKRQAVSVGNRCIHLTPPDKLFTLMWLGFRWPSLG